MIFSENRLPLFRITLRPLESGAIGAAYTQALPARQRDFRAVCRRFFSIFGPYRHVSAGRIAMRRVLENSCDRS